MNSRLERQILVEELCAKFKLPELRAGGALLKAFENDYKITSLSREEIDAIHEKGFTALHWLSLNLDDEKCKQYLSTVDYYRLHPLNGQYSLWIDDKLTFKYICAGSSLSKYLPEYYFQIMENNTIIPLPDAPFKLRTCGVLGVVSLLEERKVLAMKAIKGDSGTGFYRLDFDGVSYFMNGSKFTKDEFCYEILKHSGYIIIEYLNASTYFSKWSVGATCGVRYLAGRIDGKLKRLDSFIRFGTKASGFVDNLHAGGIVSFIDENGHFGKGGYQFDLKTCKVTNVEVHPDSLYMLEGIIPQWNDIKQAVSEFGDWFPQLSYLGFDFVVTAENQVKVLEINSLSGIDVSQFDLPLKKKKCWSFFEQRLSEYL